MQHGKKKVPRRGNYVGTNRRNTHDMKRIPDNFERGTRWAGIALVLMFGFMTLGAILWNW